MQFHGKSTPHPSANHASASRGGAAGAPARFIGGSKSSPGGLALSQASLWLAFGLLACPLIQGP